jgi:hypothetical protein
MAGSAIDAMTDATAHADDQASRKRRLLKGPEEFREARVDRPKAKGKWSGKAETEDVGNACGQISTLWPGVAK